MNIVSASILSADLCALGTDVSRAEQAGCDHIHFDVMDGVFVDNISYGLPVLESLRKHTDMFIDAHLMIVSPEKYLKRFAQSGADNITFHLEATDDVQGCIDTIHSCGKRAGLAIRPKTPAKAVFPYLPSADMILVMTVEPGFGGQGFMEDMCPKIQAVRSEMERLGLKGHIQVDGGINASTVRKAADAGADVMVAGSYLFRADDMKAAADILRNA